jgi:hypothetical protein
VPRRAKKTPPTTVRFKHDLHEFVKAYAESHPDGQSGVINDAVELYKAHVQEKERRYGAGHGS